MEYMLVMIDVLVVLYAIWYTTIVGLAIGLREFFRATFPDDQDDLHFANNASLLATLQRAHEKEPEKRSSTPEEDFATIKEFARTKIPARAWFFCILRVSLCALWLGYRYIL